MVPEGERSRTVRERMVEAYRHLPKTVLWSVPGPGDPTLPARDFNDPRSSQTAEALAWLRLYLNKQDQEKRCLILYAKAMAGMLDASLNEILTNRGENPTRFYRCVNKACARIAKGIRRDGARLFPPIRDEKAA